MAATDGRHRTGCLAGTALERPQSTSDRRPLLGGPSLLPLGRGPSEREWEAAARGPQGYEYPWGDPWEDGICNSHETGLGVTSPVGLFPRSAQAPLGLEDMAGNCWEWCDDFYYEDKRDSGSPRVVRGGAFWVVAGNLRSSVRYRVEPEDRYPYDGFRCVLAARRQP